MALKYRLNRLGWYNFENLVQTLLKIIIGPGVSSFGGVKDAGRDATFEGSAYFPNKETKWKGSWIFQVKHSEEEKLYSNKVEKFLRSIEEELSKIKTKLKKWPDNYFYITSFGISSRTRGLAKERVKRTDFNGNFHIIDGNEVCEFLNIYPQLRKSFPQLIGLEDLDYLMNKSIYEKTKSFFIRWKPILKPFVSSNHYFKALEILKKNYFVVIDGPPEVGKTTIGAAICCEYALDEHEVYFIDKSEGFFGSINPEKKQLFFADDAIGSITFDPTKGEDWGKHLPLILSRLDSKHKLIWTSRTYILRDALESSKIKEDFDKFPGIHEVLVEISDYSLENIAMILYNHSKNSDLSKEMKDLIKKHAEAICRCDSVTPERIRQLIVVFLPEIEGKVTEENFMYRVKTFLNNPGEKFLRAYKGLKESEKKLLLTLLDFGSRVRKEKLREECEKKIPDIDTTLKILMHSFLKEISDYSRTYIDFQHPSIRDMLISYFQEDYIVRKQYIETVRPEGLSVLIEGIRYYNTKDSDKHKLILRSDYEIELLLDRIKETLKAPSHFSFIEKILISAKTLIPKNEKYQALQSGEMDIKKFMDEPGGKALKIILKEMSTVDFFKNKNFCFGDWVVLFEKYYDLASYVFPTPGIEYIESIIKLFDGSYNDSDLYSKVRFLWILHTYERNWFNKISSEEMNKEIQEEFDREIAILDEESEAFHPNLVDTWGGPSYNQYMDWYERLVEAETNLCKFYEFAQNEGEYSVEDLLIILKKTESPSDQYADYYDAYHDQFDTDSYDGSNDIGDIFDDL